MRLVAALVMLAAAAFAESPAVVGVWKNGDGAVIRTYEEQGQLKAKVEKGYAKAPAGKQLIWDMKKAQGKWTGGKLLDPASGRIFNCTVEPAEGGKKLIVKGSLSLMTNTQTWTRV